MWEVVVGVFFGFYYGIFCCMVCKTGYDEGWGREQLSALCHQCRKQYHSLAVRCKPQLTRTRATQEPRQQPQTNPISQEGIVYQPISTDELFQQTDAAPPVDIVPETVDIVFESMETSMDCLYR